MAEDDKDLSGSGNAASDAETEELGEEDEQEVLPESPALADHSVETLPPRGVTYERGPGGKLIEVPND